MITINDFIKLDGFESVDGGHMIIVKKIMGIHIKEIKEKLEAQYEQTESQEIYSRRKDRVEHPFGHIKRNLKIGSFLLRGRDGVQAETSLLATCFNIARMITIIGVSGILQKLEVRA